jgi:chorismate mutase
VRELRLRATTILQLYLRIRAPFATIIDAEHESKGTGMTEQQNVLAAEREEIATRVASFKATQEKFQREREEYFVATLQKARSEFERLPFWS